MKEAATVKTRERSFGSACRGRNGCPSFGLEGSIQQLFDLYRLFTRFEFTANIYNAT
jgi:hypothetical protein